MTKFTTVYNNFSGGKVSEKFKGRFDLPAYQNGLEEMDNMLPDKIGGAFKRTGTIQIADITSTLASTSGNAYRPSYRGIPFQAGDGESYIIYLTSHTITMANFATYLHIFHNDRTKAANIYGATEITARDRGDTWTPNTATLSTFGGNHAWNYCQVGDLLFLTHVSGEQRPLVITRTAVDAFDINYVDQYTTNNAGMSQTLLVPMSEPNLSAITLTLVGSTLTASAALFNSSMSSSQTLFAVESAGSTRVLIVTAITSTTIVTVSNVIGSGDITATDDWRESLWRNPTNATLSIVGHGWPKSVAYQNQKLLWGGNLSFPDTVWASLTGNLFHLNSVRLTQDASTDSSGLNFFGELQVGTDPFSLPVGSTESNAIQWMTGGRVLTVGTTGGEYLIKNIGLDTLTIEANSNYGSSSYQAIRMGKDIVFAGATRRNFRTYRYSDENGSWVSDDLSVKLDDFNDGNFTSTPYSKNVLDFTWNAEHKLLFVAMSNTLYVLGNDPEYGINGWSTVTLGIETGHTTSVISVTSLKNTIGDIEEVFLLVRRNDGSSDSYFIEKLTIPYYETSLKIDPYVYSSTTGYYNSMNNMPRFLDLAVHEQADGSGIVTGLDVAFIGRVVTATYFSTTTFGYVDDIDIITDGAGGSKLDYTFAASEYVIFGYKYDSNIKTLPPEAGGQFGSSMGDIKQIHESYLKLYRTKNFSIGSIDKRSQTDLSFEDVEYDDLTTTDQRIQLMDNPDTDGQIVIRSTTPTPLNILALVSKGIAYD